MESLQGHYLIAAPDLNGSTFGRTVVLIVQHNEEGALGLILNRPSATPMAEVWEQVGSTPCLRKDMVHLGGPCEGPLMALHTLDEASEVEVIPGVYFSGQSENLQELVAHKQSAARFFLGYAGWAAGQLEIELHDGAWLTAEATLEQTFRCDEHLWERIRQQVEGPTLVAALGIRHVPDDPSMN